VPSNYLVIVTKAPDFSTEQPRLLIELFLNNKPDHKRQSASLTYTLLAEPQGDEKISEFEEFQGSPVEFTRNLINNRLEHQKFSSFEFLMVKREDREEHLQAMLNRVDPKEHELIRKKSMNQYGTASHLLPHGNFVIR